MAANADSQETSIHNRAGAVVGQSRSTRFWRTQTYQSWRLTVGSQWPATRRIWSPMLSRFVAPEMPSRPCSSVARSQVAAGSSQTHNWPGDARTAN